MPLLSKPSTHPLYLWREHRGWFQRRAAQYVGISQQDWSRYERGIVLPRRAQFRQIIKRTGVSACAITEAYLND